MANLYLYRVEDLMGKLPTIEMCAADSYAAEDGYRAQYSPQEGETFWLLKITPLGQGAPVLDAPRSIQQQDVGRE